MLDDVYAHEAYQHPSQGNTHTRPDLPLVRLTQPTSSEFDYDQSNYVWMPAEGSMKPSLPPPMRNKISMPRFTAAGAAFPTGMYSTNGMVKAPRPMQKTRGTKKLPKIKFAPAS